MNSLNYSGTWWAWWSNPALGMHDDHLPTMPLPPRDLKTIDYFRLLELRSALSFPDVPDDLLSDRPELRAAVTAPPGLLMKHLVRFAVLSLDSSILYSRAQDWESNYNVNQPDMIREIVTLRNDLPMTLANWQGSFCSQMKQAITQPVFLEERMLIGFAMYLRSYFPALFKRWVLTKPIAITRWANMLEPLPLEFWDTVDTWCRPSIQALHDEVFLPYTEENLEFPDLDALEIDDLDLPARVED